MAFDLDPQVIKVLLPARDCGDRRMGMRLQEAQRFRRQALISQIGQRVLVEAVGDVPGVQQLQEVDPTFAAGACNT